jgi:hypothetical protein
VWTTGVELVHGSHDAILEFMFGCNADVAQDGSGRALKKKPSTRLSKEPFWGVKVNSKRPAA